jgi:hypothetical protein
MVEWWIAISPAHTALEGPPSPGVGNANQGDAIFCRNDEAVGILEVEGTRPVEKVETIRNYFGSVKQCLKSISFGVLLAYSYQPSGILYRHANNATLIDAIKRLTTEHPTRSVILVAVDKSYGHFGTELRSSYRAGTTDKAFGILFAEGQEKERLVYFDRTKLGESPTP